jgi:hypothetical protein
MSLGFTVLETRTQASAQVAPVSRMSNLVPRINRDPGCVNVGALNATLRPPNHYR